MQTKQSVINTNILATIIAAFGVLSMVFVVSETAQAQATNGVPLAIPSRRTRRCLNSEHSGCVPRCVGDPNNLNNPGPLERVAARSTGTVATPPFWIRQPR